MPNDYIDQVKLTDNTVVDIKDTVSGYSKVFEIHATAITGTDYYTLDKSWSDISSAITNGDNLIISNIDATYPYTTINNSGIVFGATLIATDNGSTFALTDGILVINNQGTAMGMAIHMNTTIPTIPSSSAILKGDGSGGVTSATAGTDYQAPISFDGTYSSSNKAATVSTVTNAINALDGGTIGTGSTTKTITSLSQSNGNVSATFSNIAFPVTSVNTKTGAVSLTASDVGAQATLVSGTNIKTINNESLLGSGNISISGGGSEPLVTYLVLSGSTYTSDKTYTEIQTAAQNDQLVIAIDTSTANQNEYYYLAQTEPYWGFPYEFRNLEGSSSRKFTLDVIDDDEYWVRSTTSLATLSSPTFTGTPKAPTASAGTDTTQIATTAFVQGEIDSITPDDINAAPLYIGPNHNASSASYRIFGHATINTATSASTFQFLVGCLSSMTGQNQGLYLVEGSNRSSSVSIRVTALRKTGASNFTFGYYISNGEYYLGVYTSTTYAASPKILVMHNPSRCTWTFDDSIAASSTAPSGWTTISSDALATTDDINTAIGSAILASY